MNAAAVTFVSMKVKTKVGYQESMRAGGNCERLEKKSVSEKRETKEYKSGRINVGDERVSRQD